jgi:hypothetical protein
VSLVLDAPAPCNFARLVPQTSARHGVPLFTPAICHILNRGWNSALFVKCCQVIAATTNSLNIGRLSIRTSQYGWNFQDYL